MSIVVHFVLLLTAEQKRVYMAQALAIQKDFVREKKLK